MTVIVPLLTEPVADDSDTLTFAARAQVNVLELNPMFAAANLQNAENNAINVNVNTKAATVTALASAAQAAANYLGEWSTLSGSVNVPSSLSHNGRMYIVKELIPDVTLENPATSSKYIDAMEGFEPFNPVINGNMKIAQYDNTGVTPLSDNKIFDGWECQYNSVGVQTIYRNDLATPSDEWAKWLNVEASSTVASPAAGSFVILNTKVEGIDAKRYVGKTFTIGFMAKSSVAGIHSLAIRPSGLDSRYIGTFYIEAADTPQFCQVVVEGGLNTGIGTWNFNAGAVGFNLSFAQSAGSTFKSAPGSSGSWGAGNHIADDSQVNLLENSGNTFSITEVQINLGRIARPFKVIGHAESLYKCQRYYRNFDWYTAGYCGASMSVTAVYAFGQSMCKIPTYSTTITSMVNMQTVAAVSIGAQTNSACLIGGVKNASSGSYTAGGASVADARL